MPENTLYRRVYSEFTDEYDKDDVYTLSFNENKRYKGRFKIRNLAIYYAVTVYCDFIDGKFSFNEAYIQDAYDEKYEKKPIAPAKIPYYAEDLEDFISKFLELSKKIGEDYSKI